MSHSRPDPANSYPAHRSDASSEESQANRSEDIGFEELDTYLDYQPSPGSKPQDSAQLAAHHFKAGPLAMVETAFLASTAALIWLVNTYFPPGPILRLLFPLPMALVYLRWGPRAAWMSALVSGLLLSVLMGPPRSLLFLMPYAVLGVQLGFTWVRGANWYISIAAGSLLGAVGFFFRIWLMSVLVGEDLWVYLTSQVTQFLNWGLEKLVAVGLLDVGVLGQANLQAVQVLALVMVILSNVVYLFTVHLAAWLLLERLGASIPPPPTGYATCWMSEPPVDFPMAQVYTRPEVGETWLQQVYGRRPRLALVLGFTATGLLPGISAAGATPAHRRYTALADAEFLVYGPSAAPCFPLPPLQQGASPVYITRAVVADQAIPVDVFDAGLAQLPPVPHVNLGRHPAQCLTTGQAMPLDLVIHLWRQGLHWGKILADHPEDYLLLAECVVGGTTTALGILNGLGYSASGKVNSSHPACNHQQKTAVVNQGLAQAELSPAEVEAAPLKVVAAVGDPMQPVVAGMAMAASRTKPVMLAGGTQMLALYALMKALGKAHDYPWNSQRIVVGTTRWVAEDSTGDTVGLATQVNAALIGSQLSFGQSRFAALQAYESGFVKEGVGAGACAISAHLYQHWGQQKLLSAIETLLEQTLTITSTPAAGGRPDGNSPINP